MLQRNRYLDVLGRMGRAAAKTAVRGVRTIDCARALSRPEPAAAPSAEDDVRGAGADRSSAHHSLAAPDGRSPFEVLRVTRSASARDIKVPLPSAISSYPYQVTRSSCDCTSDGDARAPSCRPRTWSLSSSFIPIVSRTSRRAQPPRKSF